MTPHARLATPRRAAQDPPAVRAASSGLPVPNLHVNYLDESISFYTKLFGTGPAKVRPGYAN
ncbi:MAG TPA: hypothetical protein VG015_09365, partial [Candidatus Dormibacteraeota bacterium]|nr:hypothetical protein [Candidatus Dormibacteraeota bacterium]